MGDQGLTAALAQELPRAWPRLRSTPASSTPTCSALFGESSSSYPGPERWAKAAVPFLLGLGPKDNGKPATVPGHHAPRHPREDLDDGRSSIFVPAPSFLGSIDKSISRRRLTTQSHPATDLLSITITTISAPDHPRKVEDFDSLSRSTGSATGSKRALNRERREPIVAGIPESK